jgi:hypothetical protein
VRRAIASPHGNYVIQKVVTELPMALAAFVTAELIGVAAEASRHRYGCRIMCRILEHSSFVDNPQTEVLVDEILQEAGDLSRHNFGHHVISSILEHGLPKHRHCIAVALHNELQRNARNRNATYVIERALAHCATGDRQIIAHSLLSDPQDFVSLAENQFGFHVVRAVIGMSGDTSQYARSLLHQVIARLHMSKYGSRIADELRHNSAAVAA